MGQRITSQRDIAAAPVGLFVMGNFKVGDRVRIYCENSIIKTDTIRELGIDSCRCSSPYSWYYLKQCRRLKKKDRRRIWVWGQLFTLGEISQYVKTSKPNQDGWIEFSQVKQ